MQNFGTWTVDADILDGPVFDVTALLDFKGFLVGGSTKVTTGFVKGGADGVNVADLSLLAGYKTSDFTLAAQR